MTAEDPFFVVKDEVQKAIQTAQGLYQRWKDLRIDLSSISKDEYDWTTNELRNSLRSIEWDLEDLEETIGIVEKNPRKFKISSGELEERRLFINNTKYTVKKMKDTLTNPNGQPKSETDVRQSLLRPNTNGRVGQDRYVNLDNEIEHSNDRFLQDTRQQQEQIIHTQDDQLEHIGGHVTVLKDMSHRIGNELDEQAVMLDDFGHQIETTDSKLDGTMKKMAKVLHMTNDRRQLCAIGVLVLILVIVIILFIVL